MSLKTGVSRKQSTPNFPKKEHFLPLDTHTYEIRPFALLSTNLMFWIKQGRQTDRQTDRERGLRHERVNRQSPVISVKLLFLNKTGRLICFIYSKTSKELFFSGLLLEYESYSRNCWWSTIWISFDVCFERKFSSSWICSQLETLQVALY